MSKQKVVLAYSGGLDTSVATSWLIDKGYDVIDCCVNVGGEGKDMHKVKAKALKMGASKCYILDTMDEFADNFLTYALKGNMMYENAYPCISALSRPLISKKMVEIAHENNANIIAHGCTGKGNDQVRFETEINELDPNMKVIAPVRDWHWSREKEIDYAKKHHIPIPIDYDSPYSIDANIWGRANECGVLEDPWHSAPEDAFAITNPISKTPDQPATVTIQFHQGVPVALNGKAMSFKDIILTLDPLAGKCGIGRIDHIENRLVGIKSREIYEAPAATVLLKAHEELEDLTLEKDVAHFKPLIDQKMSFLAYNALWFSPLMKCLQKFIDESEKGVNGVIKMQLFKGNMIVLGRKSATSLYDKDLATYTSADSFDQLASQGFIKLWSLPTKVYSQVKIKNAQHAFIGSLSKANAQDKALVKNGQSEDEQHHEQ